MLEPTQLSCHELNSHSEPTLYSYSNSYSSVFTFHFDHCLGHLPHLLKAQVITWVQQNELIHIVFTTEGFWQVAIESWPEGDLNQRLLNSVQTLQSTELWDHELNSHSEPTLHSYSNFISLFSVHVPFQRLPSSRATFALGKMSYL